MTWRPALSRTTCASLLGLASCFSAPRYQGPPSSHFDGSTFQNQVPVSTPGLAELIRLADAEGGPWDDWTENPRQPPPPARVGRGALRITFINHATTLIQMDGLNILTDPIWSERCSPVSWVGPKRVRPPGLPLEALPPLDAVLVSHNHYDHLDLPTLRRIVAGHPGVPIFVGLGVDRLLEEEDIPGAVPLDWKDERALSEEVRVVAWSARHFSGRGLGDRGATLWMSFVLRGPGGPVYFAGDTGFGPHFAAAGEAYGPFRLALLPIGAYLPRWFMAPVHISPEEAVRAAQALRAETSVAIHFGTFPLAKDGQYQPLRDLAAALDEAPELRFWALLFGEGRDVPALPGTPPG